MKTTFWSDRFVTTSERNWLERKKSDLFGIIQSEANDRADLIVVDTVHEGRNEYNFHARFVQVIDRTELDVK